MAEAPRFDYEQAFSRNIGWVTVAEQATLRGCRVAMAGTGGVGGGHLLTLARLGIGAFNLADFDHFDLVNFNRQAGAMMSTLGRPKVDVLSEMALDINPSLDLRIFREAIGEHNLDDFLADVDLYVDSLDFFAFEARKQLFAACARKNIPALTAAPLGMGVAFLAFLPGRMTFEEYFRMEGQPDFEQGLRFLLGLAPARLHMGYLADPTRVRLDLQKGPSTIMACQFCAGMAATHALKILLGRGDVPAAPRGLHFDAYRNRLVHTWLPWGNRNPLQRLKLQVGRQVFGQAFAAGGAVPAAPAASASLVERVLDSARWAPSGDNSQQWRFELGDERHFVVHGADSRDQVVYDFEGRPSQLSLGALLETISIAASQYGARASFTRRGTEANERQPAFDVELIPDATVTPDPLFEYVTRRSTQRRPMPTRPLAAGEKRALEAAVGERFRIQWVEGAGPRWRMAKLLFRNGRIRLTLPEAYPAHMNAIQWNSRFSEEGIPDQAIGMDPLGLRVMRWAMRSWQRVDRLNRFLGGTWLPRLQLDLLPGYACAAHFVIVAAQPPRTVEDYVEAGRALQRFWLTATYLGLQLQPETTPFIFCNYVGHQQRFSRRESLWPQAQALRRGLVALLGESTVQQAVFAGRLGAGPAATTRSLRLPLARLLKPAATR